MPRARRFARQRLEGAVPEDVLDTIELCVSELATNCVLHASTEFRVHVAAVERGGARVEVQDASPVPPRQVPYGLSAVTGRGLALVANLSSGWGVDLAGDGKTVWCEVWPGSGPELDEASLLDAWGDLEEEPAPVAAPAPGASTVRLLGYPVRRGMRAREHTDALLRECMLLRAAYEDGVSDVPGRLADLAEVLRSRYSAALDEPERRRLEAFSRGEATVDLEYSVMPGAREHVRQWQTVIAEMDAYCRDQQLLTLATPPDVAELRAWVLQEFLRQLDGGQPRPWAGPLD